MKYMQNGGFSGHPLMRLTLLWSLALLTGLWATNAFMFLSRMGLSPASIERYYLGSQEDFSTPRSAAAMLETTHAHLPVMAMVVLMLTHLMIFAPLSERSKRRLISLSFGSVLLGEGSGWLVRFVHPGFSWLKLACFLLFQACLALLIAGLAAFLLSGKIDGRGQR